MNCYEAIRLFYGDQRAERSGVLKMQHIDEGLVLLQLHNATRAAKDAWCLHPLVQADDDLDFSIGRRWFNQLPPDAVALAMEYRSVANAALSDQVIDDGGPVWPGPWPRLSSMSDVNLMLRADKIQNRADFELHHLGKHERSDQLALYFQVWLEVLGVSEHQYHYYVQLMKAAKFTGR